MREPLVVSLARRLMQHPAAPYHEFEVRAEAEAICSEHGLPFEHDSFGNLYVRYAPRRKMRCLALAAHLDHPGFCIREQNGPGRWAGEFRGGVPDEFFNTGIPLRLMPGSQAAVLGKRLPGKRQFEIRLRRPRRISNRGAREQTPGFAVWELPDFEIRGTRIYGRACDDLIGAAAVLATLIALKRREAPVNVLGLLSRAEEVGFHGALMAAQSGRIPKDALVVSLETSREMPPIQMGEGAIIRVGDRVSIFDSEATRYLSEVATLVAQTEPEFKVQRALMSGGTCEATAFQQYGFQTAAVCVALGNYHNCGARRRIAPEFVDATDSDRMVKLLAEAAIEMANYPKLLKSLPDRLKLLSREARSAMKTRRACASHEPSMR